MAIINGAVAAGKARVEAAGYPEGKVVLTPSEKERILKTKNQAKETLVSAQASQVTAEKASTVADRQMEFTEKALAKSKAAKRHAEYLKAHVGQSQNLGLLYDCPMLKTNPEAIRGAGSLKDAVRNQLHLEYAGLTYDDGCGCF
jgi:hypothetical protein